MFWQKGCVCSGFSSVTGRCSGSLHFLASLTCSAWKKLTVSKEFVFFSVFFFFLKQRQWARERKLFSKIYLYNYNGVACHFMFSPALVCTCFHVFLFSRGLSTVSDYNMSCFVQFGFFLCMGLLNASFLLV